MKTIRAQNCSVCGQPIASIVGFDDDGAILACNNACDFDADQDQKLEDVREWAEWRLSIHKSPKGSGDDWEYQRDLGKAAILEELLEDILPKRT